MRLGLGNNLVKQGLSFTRFPTMLTLLVSLNPTALTLEIEGVQTALILFL